MSPPLPHGPLGTDRHVLVSALRAPPPPCPHPGCVVIAASFVTSFLECPPGPAENWGGWFGHLEVAPGRWVQLGDPGTGMGTRDREGDRPVMELGGMPPMRGSCTHLQGQMPPMGTGTIPGADATHGDGRLSPTPRSDATNGDRHPLQVQMSPSSRSRCHPWWWSPVPGTEQGATDGGGHLWPRCHHLANRSLGVPRVSPHIPPRSPMRFS